MKLRLPPHRASSDPLAPAWPGQHNLQRPSKSWETDGLFSVFLIGEDLGHLWECREWEELPYRSSARTGKLRAQRDDGGVVPCLPCPGSWPRPHWMLSSELTVSPRQLMHLAAPGLRGRTLHTRSALPAELSSESFLAWSSILVKRRDGSLNPQFSHDMLGLRRLERPARWLVREAPENLQITGTLDPPPFPPRLPRAGAGPWRRG